MKEEAEQLANSPEGMERLLHALLHSSYPAQKAFIRRLRYYIGCKVLKGRYNKYMQDCLTANDNTPIQYKYISREEVKSARDSYRELQREIPKDLVLAIKRSEGRAWNRGCHSNVLHYN